MTSAPAERGAAVAALRAATAFDVNEEYLRQTASAEPTLLRDMARIAALERHVRALLLEATPLPTQWRAACLPVLGNVAEAVVEIILADLGWQPYFDDDAGESHTAGVDLLMLDPSVEKIVAIEVKSTIQSGRWPRLSRAGQMSPAWLDSPSNAGMDVSELDSRDVHRMIVQLHFTRRQWRSCIFGAGARATPIVDLAQLADLSWLKS